jgi:peptidyl-prolyl cis-trans isomerase B (cyclophilin B)
MKKLVLLGIIGLFVAVSFVQAAEQPKKDDIRAENPVVKIATSDGDIYVELYVDKAPLSVKNFLRYTSNGFYDGTIFHRVIKNFMVQGGGMGPDMKRKRTQSPIKNEAANGLKNKRGTIAMARTNAPDSATSQFFINHVDNAFLDYKDPSPRGIGYAVFGKVIKGMDVVDAIAVTPTRKPGDVPLTTVTIESVTVVEKKCCGKCEKAAEAKCCGKEGCTKEGKCSSKKDAKCCGTEGKCCKAADAQCCGKEGCAKEGKCSSKKDAKCCGTEGKCCKATDAQCCGKEGCKGSEKKEAACCGTDGTCCKKEEKK